MSFIVSSATSSCPLLCSRSLFSPSSALKSLVLVEATYTDLYAKNNKRFSSVVAIRRKNMTWSCSFSSLTGQRNSSTHAFPCKMKFSPVYLKGCFQTCGCLQNSVSSYSKLSSGIVCYECDSKASWNYEGKSRVKMGISNRPAFNTVCSVSQVQQRSVYTARWINATKRITEMDIKASLVEDMKPINEGEMKTKLARIMVDESYNEVNGTPRKIVEKEEDKNKLEQMMIEERKRQIEVAERVFEEDVRTAETSENIAKEDTGKKKVARKMIKEDKRKKKSVQKIFKEDTEEIILKEDPKPIVAKNEAKERLSHLYGDVLVVDDVKTAKAVVDKLTSEYRDFVHACDTEVAEINVKRETPVDHGRMICFSIYCEDNEGNKAEFGIDSAKSCLWVDVLDGEEGVMSEFRRYFEDPDIKKVWHNYSFDKHIFQNHGIEVNGFYADTMHLARLWNSAKQREGGYSLEALTKDEKLMKSSKDELVSGKISMKKIFGRKAIKKDGKEGKLVTIPSVEELQRTERIPWICYSALDAKSTLKLWRRLAEELKARKWVTEIEKGMDLPNCNMYEFYKKYWLPFGDLLTKMERRGVQVDRNHLAEIEKVAIREQEISASRFKKWASKYCADACYMNVNSDIQIRQLLFAGMPNSKNSDESVPMERSFTTPNTDNFIEEGKKAPRKYREFTLTGVDCHIDVEVFTQAGWPATSRSALKALAGNVSIDYEMIDDEEDNSEDELVPDLEKSLVRVTSEGIKDDDDIIVPESKVDLSVYGNAYKAFGGGKEGSEACYAIAALCEVSAINTLISNFIQPLQGKDIADSTQGRVHCSLNINTETGRLSARKPNLQNQPALEKDRYKIRKAFVAAPGKTLVVADYGQLELRILAHLANCKSMIDAFQAGGDFHSRTAMNMYPHVCEAVHEGKVILEWQSEKNEKPPLPLLKDVFASERRKAKMLNFSIAYGKTAIGLSKDWKVTRQEAQETLNLWYNDRKEVQEWQKMCMEQAQKTRCVKTLLGRPRHFPDFDTCSKSMQHHLLRAAINTPVQGSAADVAMCAMLKLADNERLKELQWDLILQVHDEVILEGPAESAEEAKALVVECMSNPFDERDLLKVDLAVDAKYAENWYAAK